MAFNSQETGKSFQSFKKKELDKHKGDKGLSFLPRTHSLPIAGGLDLQINQHITHHN